MTVLSVAAPAAETLNSAVLPQGANVWHRLKAKVNDRLGYALADQIAYSFGNMVVAAVLSRHCAQRQFGIYILTQRAMDVLIQLCNVFLWAPFTFNLPNTPSERRATYQGSIFSLQILFCVAFTGILLVASHFTAKLVHSEFHQTFFPLVVAGGGILFREFTRRMYFAQLRLREAFWTDLVTVSLQIAGLGWLGREHRLGVSETLDVLCAGATMVSLWWLVRDATRLRLNLGAIWTDLVANLGLGRWFLGSNMVFLASSQCNPWILGSLLGGASVGAYAVCESVVNIPRVALTSMQNIMAPTIAGAQAQSGSSGVRRTVRRLDRMLFFGSAGFGVCILLVGPLTARLIFKTVPGNALSILALLALNLVVYASTLAQSYGLTALGRADMTLYANSMGLIAQASVCLFLVHAFGVPGAALAMLIGSAVVLAFRQWCYCRETRLA